MNVLLEKNYATPHNAIPFDRISDDDFLPAAKEAIAITKKRLTEIKNISNCSFNNVIESFERSMTELSLVMTVFSNLKGADTSDKREAIAKDLMPMFSAFHNEVNFDLELFAKIKNVYDRKKEFNLSVEENTLLEKIYKDFVRNGALLSEDKKTKVKAIDEELTKLALTFSENVLKDTNEYFLEITDKNDLDGLPVDYIEAIKGEAKKRNKDNSWIVTLKAPSLIPFMKYSKKRELRKKLQMLSGTIGSKNGTRDNKAIVHKISELRFERANLLGYKTHADYVLEQRMSESKDGVNNFLNDLLSKFKTFGEKDLNDLQNFAKKDNIDELYGYDLSYYMDQLQKERFSFDEELLRPYFKLENVINGAFIAAKNLYSLNFKKVTNIPVYHPEVETYEVFGDDGKFIGLFYADFFPRESKRSGAWMTLFREQNKNDGINNRPHVAIVCNFTKPTESKPSLLTLDEVTTLFHEFGHALHGLLSDCKYETLAGTNVYWDFVELPSQIMENWVYESELLDQFARHYQTNEVLPKEMIKKIKDSMNYMAGYMTCRQLMLGMIDMSWHAVDPKNIKDVYALESKVIEKIPSPKRLPELNTSCSFSHIFAGGYSAGYYSYKWAEVLEADAFEFFKEKGIFNKSVANSFKENILMKGGSEHPMTLYKRFRGKAPATESLLKKCGYL